MKLKDTPPILDTRRFADSIRRQPAFFQELPKGSFAELPANQRRQHFQHAMASGALSIAQRLERSRGEYDLGANLFKLVSSLASFGDSEQAVEALRDTYGDSGWMPKNERSLFHDQKQEIIEFNHTLREVINAGASRFSFDELLAFMTTMYEASGGETTLNFHNRARSALVGMRNEIAVEQVLIAAGVDYELGDAAQDAKGGDFIIDGVSIDVKTSEQSARYAQEKARRNGFNPRTIVWSHINFTDFEGQLTLPPEMNDAIFAKIKPDIDMAITSEKLPRSSQRVA